MGLEDFPQLVCCEECQRASFGARRRRATHYRVSCKMVPAEEARSKGYRAPYPSLSAFAFEKEIRTLFVAEGDGARDRARVCGRYPTSAVGTAGIIPVTECVAAVVTVEVEC